MNIKIDQIQNMIYVIRGQKVMLDSDLAKLYEVETTRVAIYVLLDHLEPQKLPSQYYCSFYTSVFNHQPTIR